MSQPLQLTDEQKQALDRLERITIGLDRKRTYRDDDSSPLWLVNKMNGIIEFELHTKFAYNWDDFPINDASFYRLIFFNAGIGANLSQNILIIKAKDIADITPEQEKFIADGIERYCASQRAASLLNELLFHMMPLSSGRFDVHTRRDVDTNGVHYKADLILQDSVSNAVSIAEILTKAGIPAAANPAKRQVTVQEKDLIAVSSTKIAKAVASLSPPLPLGLARRLPKQETQSVRAG